MRQRRGRFQLRRALFRTTKWCFNLEIAVPRTRGRRGGRRLAMFKVVGGAVLGLELFLRPKKGGRGETSTLVLRRTKFYGEFTPARVELVVHRMIFLSRSAPRAEERRAFWGWSSFHGRKKAGAAKPAP